SATTTSARFRRAMLRCSPSAHVALARSDVDQANVMMVKRTNGGVVRPVPTKICGWPHFVPPLPHFRDEWRELPLSRVDEIQEESKIGVKTKLPFLPRTAIF